MYYTNGSRRVITPRRAEAVAYAAQMPSPAQQQESLWKAAIATVLVVSTLFTVLTLS
jgi:hypothetical protein